MYDISEIQIGGGRDKGKEGIARVGDMMYYEEQQDLIFEGLGCDPGCPS